MASTTMVHDGRDAVAIEHSWIDRDLYPFATRTFPTRDGRMSYLDEGEGPPVVLVHGTPSWSFEWRGVVRALSASRRVIAPDHLGFGLSDKPEEAPYRPEDHAKRLLALFDALNLSDVTLVVHDFGGPIGLPLALDRPDRIARIVVINSWMWPLGDDARAARVSRFVRSALGRFLYRQLNVSPRVLLPSSFADRRRLTRSVHRQYTAPFRTRRERTAPWVLGCELTGSDPYFARLWTRREVLGTMPLTVVWGERDPFFGRSSLERWTIAFPNARVILAAASGHFPQEEEPEIVVAAIRAIDLRVGA